MTGDEATLGVESNHAQTEGQPSGENGSNSAHTEVSANTDQNPPVASMTQKATNGQSPSHTNNGASVQPNKTPASAKRQVAPIDPKLLDDVVEMFAPFNEEWSSTTRSIRIDGTVTSVRLENFFWRILGNMAKEQGLQIPQLLTRLSRIARSGETSHSNFTSFIRVCCGRFIDAKLGSESEQANDVQLSSSVAHNPRPTEFTNGV